MIDIITPPKPITANRPTENDYIAEHLASVFSPCGDAPIQHGPATYTSSPLDPTNNWRDIDGDGISDYDETHYSEAYDWLILFLTMTVSAFVFIKAKAPILGAIIGFSLAAIIGLGAVFLQGFGSFDNDMYLLKKAITIQTFLAAVSILMGMAGLLYAELSTGMLLLTIISVFIGGICVVYYYDIYEKLLVEEII